MSMSLMTTRRFAPLFWCQFFAAFGDNFLKTALVFVILFEVSGANSAVLITLAGATLIAPFFFLSGLGGELADRYDKAWVAQRIKLTEIGAAMVARRRLRVSFAQLAVRRGVPVRHARLAVRPDQIRHPARPLEAPRAAVRQCADRSRHLPCHPARHHRRRHCRQRQQQSDPFRLADDIDRAGELAARACSFRRPPKAAPDLAINRNILASTGSLIKQVRADPRLWWGAIVASWFWLVGALVLSLLPPLVSFTIGGSEQVVTLFLTIFSVSVGDRLRSCRLACRRAHRAAADPGRHRAARACSRSISAGPPPRSCRRQAR